MYVIVKQLQSSICKVTKVTWLIFSWFIFLFVWLVVSPSLPLVRFGQVLRYAYKRIININESVHRKYLYIVTVDNGCRHISVVTPDRLYWQFNCEEISLYLCTYVYIYLYYM